MFISPIPPVQSSTSRASRRIPKRWMHVQIRENHWFGPNNRKVTMVAPKSQVNQTQLQRATLHGSAALNSVRTFSCSIPLFGYFEMAFQIHWDSR